MSDFDFPLRLMSLFGLGSKPPPPPAHDHPHAEPGKPTGPAGGPKDLDYAAPYADAGDISLRGIIQSFVHQLTGTEDGPHAPGTIPVAPKKTEAPEKPEGPGETHAFDFGSFVPFVKKVFDPTPTPTPKPVPKPNVADWQDPAGNPRSKRPPEPTKPDPADWQDAPRTARARENPNAPPPPPRTVEDRRKWKVGVGEDGVSGGVSKQTTTEDKSAPSGQRMTHTGAAIDLRGNASAGTRTATELDEEGHMKTGASATGSIGRDGFNGAVSSTKDGKSTTGALKIDPFSKETAAKVSHGDEHRNASVSVSHKGDTNSIGVSGKAGLVSASASVSLTDGVKKGEIGDEGIDATIHEFVGDGTYVEYDKGHSVSAGADVEYGAFGAGGSGYKGSLTKRRHFHAGKEEERDQEHQMLQIWHPEMRHQDLLFDSVADVDIDKLKAGEGYSIEQNKQKGGEGHIKAGITIGLGKDDAEMSQTVLARDAKGDIRVMVAQGDEQTLSGSISVSKAASFTGKESKANSSSVAFTAHGPDGVKAVKTFQQTGLLPGADRIAKIANPSATDKFNSIKQEWEASVKAASYLGGYPAIMMKARIDTLREQMCEAAGPLNDAFLRHKGGSLDDTGVAGVTYDDHTVAQEKSKDVSLALGGHTIAHSGSKQTEYEKGYRADKGEAHLEQGALTEDSYVFAKDEVSTLAMDPRGYSKDGDQVAMVLGGKLAMNQDQRDIMAKLGPKAFDMPKETLEAWRDGSMNESELANVAVTMTDGQLNKIRDKLAIPNVVQTMAMTNSVGAFYDQVQRGGMTETKMKAIAFNGRDPDAKRDAKRDVERHDELNQLYASAASARARQVLKMAAGGPDSAFLQEFGMKQMLDTVGHVKTPEDFLKLTPEEQKLVVATGAIAMRKTGQSSFECMRLVLLVKDKNQRNDLMRQMFETEERREKGSDNAVDFVQWVHNSGEANHIPKEEMSEILSGATVRSDDADTKQATLTHDYHEMLCPGLGNQMVGRKLADSTGLPKLGVGGVKFDDNLGEHMRQRSEERDADRITDLLQSARGPNADPKAVEQAMAAAVKENPEFVPEMWKLLERDPARAAWANYLLEGTTFHREPPKK